jgi:hypothetical protein
MFDSMTKNIEDSRLNLERLVLDARTPVESIRELTGDDFVEIKASYQTPTP